MMSPTGLQKNGGTDYAQNYLTTHDLGTGPYTLTDAQVGSHYAMASFPDYWGPKPYFEKVEMPVITDTSAQQLQFNNGQLAAILHDLPSSAVKQYLDNSKYSHYSLPTMMSNYLYVNPHKGIMKDQATRTAVMEAIDVDQLVKQTYFGRGKVGAQMYPPYVLAADYGKQTVAHDPSALTQDRRGTARRSEVDHHRLRLEQSRQPADQQPASDSARRGGPHRQGAGLPDLGDLRLDRRRRQAAPEIFANLGLAGRSVAVHLGPHRLGCRRRTQLPGLLVAAADRRAGEGPAERCTATVFGRGR